MEQTTTPTWPDTRANPAINRNWRDAFPELICVRNPHHETRVLLVREAPRSSEPHLPLATIGALLMIGCGVLSPVAAPAVAFTGVGCGLVVCLAGLLAGRWLR